MKKRILQLSLIFLPVFIIVWSLGCAGKTPKPKSDPTLPDRVYIITLGAGQSQAEFKIPSACPVYGIMTIDYSIRGNDTYAAVEANAFEDSKRSVEHSFSNSALPIRLKIDFRYMGSIPVKERGSVSIASTAKLRRNFSSKYSYQHLFEIRNTGDCILKSQGYGMITFRIRVADETGKITDWGSDKMQLLSRDLYPGDSTMFSCLMPSLPVGKCTLQLVANIHNESVLNVWDPGDVVSRVDLPLVVTNEENPIPGLIILQKEPVLPMPVFPNAVFHWEEFLQTFQVHAMDRNKIYGQLYLELPEYSQYITVKIVTPRDVSSSSWNITANPNPRLTQIDNKNWRKSVYKDSDGYPIFVADYSPYSALQFSLNADSTINSDLVQMKNLGIHVLWASLYPQTFTNDKNPLVMELKCLRKLRMKIIPSIYSRELRTYLEQVTGVKLRPAGDSGPAFSMVDALDENFPKAISLWFDKVYKEWGDIFYRTADGKIPINLCEGYGYGEWVERYGGKSPEDIAGFQDWVRAKYLTVPGVNSTWNSKYTDITEIDPRKTTTTDYSQAFIFSEWNPGVRDWDRYRSFILNKQYGKAVNEIQKKHSNISIGVMPVGVYGLESTYGSNYYSLYGFNWLGERTGVLQEDLFDKENGGFDFIAYNSLGKNLNTKKIVEYAQSTGISPILMLEYNGTCFIQGVDCSSGWEKSSGWRGLTGVKGRDIRVRTSLFPRLRDTVEQGGVPGLWSWNNYSNFARMTDIQKHEIAFYQTIVHNQ